MEQFFIYLIVFVIIIASSIRKSKKQQQAKAAKLNPVQPPPQSPTTSETIEDLFKRISGDAFSESPQPQMNPISVSVSTPLQKEKKFPQPKAIQEGFKKSSPTNYKYSSTDLATDGGIRIVEEYEDYGLNSDEDIRKAFVYAEIFNRKYA